MTNKCTVEGCDASIYAKGLCLPHYRRKRKYGDPSGGTWLRAPANDRFSRRVDVRGEDECWPWTGTTNRQGYGRFGLGPPSNKFVGAHVFACEQVKGPRPEGMGVLHSCDNPLCCNPKHLSFGTHKQNMEQCKARGRNKWPGVRGEQQGKALLTEAAVREIKANPQISGAAFSRKFKTSRATIYDVRAGRTWMHIT